MATWAWILTCKWPVNTYILFYSAYYRFFFLAGGGQTGAPNTREHIHLKKQYTKLQEENNLLKYKVELLLDMLAASSADCLVLQKELEAVKKPPAARRAGKR